MTATYPEGYTPGSELERQRLAAQAAERDAAAEAERIKDLPEPEAAPPPIPALSQSERAELDFLRAQAANRPYNGESNG